VAYTVWHNDRLVGESDLDYVANTSELKFGDFTATEYGESLIRVLMAPRQAVCARASLAEIEALYSRRQTIQLELRAPDGRVIPTDNIEITDLDWLVTLGADSPDDWQADLELARADLHEELLAGDDDESERIDVLPPEWLNDDHDEPDFDEFDVPDLEFSDQDMAPQEFPRYQIQVRIQHGG